MNKFTHSQLGRYLRDHHCTIEAIDHDDICYIFNYLNNHTARIYKESSYDALTLVHLCSVLHISVPQQFELEAEELNERKKMIAEMVKKIDVYT